VATLSDITDCGAACLASVGEHYKLKLPVARIWQIAGTDKRGTNVLGMVKAAEQLGHYVVHLYFPMLVFLNKN
jgi:ABC-type bacteriocin/lantibiotic exporter with double-glycine peptidase domain